RCLYGVDKNPLAVEMAKLSLWLITLDRNRPFTFLDHALKCGDSLVGADEDMFLRWAHGLKDSAATLFDETLRQQLETARAKRRELESFEVREVRDAERKAALLSEAEVAMARVKLGCDLLIGTRLLGLKPRQVEARLSTLLLEYFAKEQPDSTEAREALAAARNVRAFHWAFEFPEVFERGGFGAFVGNPPFIGGRRIRETFGDDYRDSLDILFANSSGNADYSAFFFLRGFRNLRASGTMGLLGTNSISQGDTRRTGLDQVLSGGGTIYRAVNSMPWPGIAAVFVSIVHVFRGSFHPPMTLDEQTVQYISTALDSQRVEGTPFALMANNAKSFQGSVVVGMGFILSPDEAQTLITRQPRNREVLFPYLNGEDLNSSPQQLPSRWIINFFDWPLTKAGNYPEALRIVREKVYPVRIRVNRETHREYWWHYGDKRPALYQAIRPLRRVLLIAQTSKTLAFAFVSPDWVYSHSIIVIASESSADFAVLQSNIHLSWVLRYSSSLKSDACYRPSDCFVTCPFPASSLTLQQIGEKYYEHRQTIMQAREEGLTATYNCFHDPDERSADIASLRELHVEMDQAVAAAYGWDDLDLGHGFHATPQGTRFTLSEPARREVLARLLRLNHERYEAEVAAGLHEKKGFKGNKGAKGRGTQGTKGTRGTKKRGEGGTQMGML
ncbi:MAG: hypothetical protein IT317_06060, partial [Anaerolineales bacterium]|nr:hypothetical protein [Anaerolineales bacterium]